MSSWWSLPLGLAAAAASVAWAGSWRLRRARAALDERALDVRAAGPAATLRRPLRPEAPGGGADPV